jgi:hypothetical protein
MFDSIMSGMRPAPILESGGTFAKVSNIVIGLFSIGISFVLFMVFLDLQSDYEQYCTGLTGLFVEAFGDGQCTEMENYLFVTGAGTFVCGLLGFVLLIVGLVSTPKRKQQVIIVPQYIPTSQQYVQQPQQQYAQQPQQYVQQPKQVYATQTVNSHHQKPKSGFSIILLSVIIGVLLLPVLAGILYVWADSLSNAENLDPDGDFDGDGIINSEDLDDDNDGFLDTDDWYDKGNGGIEINFTKFRAWESGNYDSGGGLPDVYAYVGIGNANCGNMQYFSYLDDINVDASSLNNWQSFTYDFDEDATSVCIEVTIYDEDSWAPDEILDFIPGSANYYQHSFDLSSGEGDASIDHDNRGENSLSIELEYTFKRVSING